MLCSEPPCAWASWRLCRCKRPKLVVLADVLLKRRPDVGEPARLCAYEDISDEAVTALEG